MGSRNDELTTAQEAHAEQVVRTLLTSHDEPTAMPPPPMLASQIVARLPHLPPVQAHDAIKRARRRRIGATVGITLLIVLLTALGAWGTFVNSTGPAWLFGGTDTALGHMILVLTLVAKPLLKLITAQNLPTLTIGVVLVALAAWAWRRLAHYTPVPAFAEVEP